MAKRQQHALPQDQYQRTPDHTIDNICILFKRDGSMTEPELVLGEFNKKCKFSANGEEKSVHGLCLAAGGHFERMGWRPNTYGEREGSIDLLDAGLQEMVEEIGVQESGIVESLDVGFVDCPLSDPRKHITRHAVVRWIDADPSTSEELQTLLCVPLSKLGDLIGGRISVTSKRTGTQLGFVLGHDHFIQQIWQLPNVRKMVERIKRNQMVQEQKFGSIF